MNRMKIHRTVEYLKVSGFYHDTMDVEDGIEKILAEFGIYEEFTEEEMAELRKELFRLAEQNEFNEIVRIVEVIE